MKILHIFRSSIACGNTEDSGVVLSSCGKMTCFESLKITFSCFIEK